MTTRAALSVSSAPCACHDVHVYVEELERAIEPFRDVRVERERQNEKWGEQNHSDEWWLAILTEEVGEAAKGVLHEKFGGDATLRDEVVQIAAVAVAWLGCIDRHRKPSFDAGPAAQMSGEDAARSAFSEESA